MPKWGSPICCRISGLGSRQGTKCTWRFTDYIPMYGTEHTLRMVLKVTKGGSHWHLNCMNRDSSRAISDDVATCIPARQEALP